MKRDRFPPLAPPKVRPVAPAQADPWPWPDRIIMMLVLAFCAFLLAGFWAVVINIVAWAIRWLAQVYVLSCHLLQ